MFGVERLPTFFKGLIVAATILCIFIVALITEHQIKVSEEIGRNELLVKNEVTLRVGVDKWVELKNSSQGFIYLGMPNNERFALSHTGYSACPVYYPVSVEEFSLYNHRFRLVDVNSMQIKLVYLGKV